MEFDGMEIPDDIEVTVWGSNEHRLCNVAAQNATPSRAAPTGTACESSTSAATTDSNPSWTHSSISVEARSSLSPCIDANIALSAFRG